MSKHKESTIWAVRQIGEYPNFYVKTDGDRCLEISSVREETVYAYSISFTRRDARLLAKRINQCLDETRR